MRESGKFCPERDSCNYKSERRSRVSMELDWRSRNCFCDHLCDTFGDCCVDAAYFDPESQRKNFGKFECRALKQYGNIYMRSQCSEKWTGSEVLYIF